ncbi:hypothetical protein K431DRAFT_287954 [Polychaeton citri CBS 116435]|uniref:Uncharacterized protein n=1 Tax=Polychaeton citri CBS 116435 TaxID=1314669 RepID=A0A9P4ULR8_9PEZI|nr:hypothetical protein K431DRAFT_287954 [Polychaeton citri CBS 116435]
MVNSVAAIIAIVILSLCVAILVAAYNIRKDRKTESKGPSDTLIAQHTADIKNLLSALVKAEQDRNIILEAILEGQRDDRIAQDRFNEELVSTLKQVATNVSAGPNDSNAGNAPGSGSGSSAAANPGSYLVTGPLDPATGNGTAPASIP